MHVALKTAKAHDIEALLDGVANLGPLIVPYLLDPPEVLGIIAALYRGLDVDPGWGAWLIAYDGVVVGLCSLTGPPQAGRGEIGYSVFPQFQGRGHATAAVALMLEEARTHGLRALGAETTTLNGASQAILLKAGFSRTRERFDAEDGDIVVWDIRL